MRVAVVVRSLKVGGMERVAISLAKAFKDAGHESHLIYFKKRRDVFTPEGIDHIHHWDLEKMLLKTGVGVFAYLAARILNMFLRQSYFIWNGFFTSLLFRYRLSRIEKDGTPFDLIIIRGQGTFEFLWYRQDGRYVQVSENILFPDAKMDPVHRLYARLLYGNKNMACVSAGVLQSYDHIAAQAGFKAKKAVVLTNPIDLETIREKSGSYVPEIDGPYIVNVGRISPVKQLGLLVDAFLYMKARYGLPHKLVLVGKGRDEGPLREKIAAADMQDQVILAGLQTNPYPWFAHADLFVLSSKHEGLGMVLLEALACGTNLVATRSPGGVADIMQGDLASLLCDPTPEALGEKIYEQLTSPDAIDFQKHLKPFLAETIVSRYIEEFAAPAKA